MSISILYTSVFRSFLRDAKRNNLCDKTKLGESINKYVYLFHSFIINY